MPSEEVVTLTLDRHDKTLEQHSSRLDYLERAEAANGVKIANLCDKLEAQTKSINWLIGIIVSALLTFFVYAAQQGLIN